MSDSSRKELKALVRSTSPSAGIYRVFNLRTGAAVVGSSTNLGSFRNRFEFARSTNSPGALDPRIKSLADGGSLSDLDVELLEELAVATDATPAAIQADLETLEQLWREKLNPSTTG